MTRSFVSTSPGSLTLRALALRTMAKPLALTVFAAVLAAVPAAAQFGKNAKIQYRDFDWKIYHATHFDVYYYEDAEHQLDRVVSFAESAYDHLSREFDYQIPKPTPLIFYRTHNEFQQNNIILNYIPEGLGAFASSVRNRMVLPVDMPDNELLELILHELTHIFQYHILYGGSAGKGITSSAPQFINEGMASYYAADENARDKMYLRDAVVNDNIPEIGQNPSGFFAYRYGHAFFDYIEETYGKEGVRAFLLELRSTLGSRVEPAIERAFTEDPEDFSADFRRWLRRKYLPELVVTGEPADFGRQFRQERGKAPVNVASPVASPSGDLIAAFVRDRGEVDIVLYDTKTRERFKNLTKGFTTDVQYFIAQEIGEIPRKMGRDLAFSPDGDQIAAFVRKEGSRKLALINVRGGGVRELLDVAVDQAINPAWSPDGGTIAFAGHRDGQFDIFEYDLSTGSVTNLTNDTVYDGAPSYSPDGESIVFTSATGDTHRIYRIERSDPSIRFPITDGEDNATDPVYSADASRLYFTSDYTGANNIFSKDMATGEIIQHTNSVTGAYMPMPLSNPAGDDRLVYTAFWRGRHDLYLLDEAKPITDPIIIVEPDEEEPEGAGLQLAELPEFEPTIEANIDSANIGPYKSKFFIEGVSGSSVAVTTDQRFIGTVAISLSDFLGDRRILAQFQTVDSFRNFNITYANLKNRLQKVATVFDDRTFRVLSRSSSVGSGEIRAERRYEVLGAFGSLVYPLDFNHRVEGGVGWVKRTIEDAVVSTDFGFGGTDTLQTVPLLEDDFPFARLRFVGDSTVFSGFAPISGRRYYARAEYAPDTEESGSLFTTFALDWRQYFPLGRRGSLAMRGYGFTSDGNSPNLTFFGGTDDVRGVDFRTLSGNQGLYANVELRFPLIDFLITPVGVLSFQGIQGNIFFDIGGAWCSVDGIDFNCGNGQPFDFYDSENDRLDGGIAAYGFGFSTIIFGLPFNMDFAKVTDLETSADSFATTWWIGFRF